MVPWALVSASSFIDTGWRVKAGFVLFLALGAALCIYPTYHDERHGKIDDSGLASDERSAVETARARARSTPSAARRSARPISSAASCSRNIPFRLVRGLDLKGGLRLVYTVDVDEAIKDKRDRYYDEMRHRARHRVRLPHGRQGADGRRARASSRQKVRIEKSREHAGIDHARRSTTPPTRRRSTRTSSRSSPASCQVQRSPDRKKVTFRIKGEVESQIRERRGRRRPRRPSTAASTSSASRRPSVTTRDEDIIIEVPGEDEKPFEEIREIISQTARLEFKMLDDDADFFEQYSTTPRARTSRGALVLDRERARRRRARRSRATTRASSAASRRGRCATRCKRLKEWVGDARRRPTTTRSASTSSRSTTRTPDTRRGARLAHFYLFSKAEITGDMHPRRAGAARPADRGGLGGWLRRDRRSPRSAAIASRRSPATTSSAASRSSSTARSRARRSSRPRSPAATRSITHGRGRPRAAARKTRASSSWCSAPARCPRRSRPRTSSASARRSARDAIAQGVQGRRSPASCSCSSSWSSTTSRAGLIADIAVLFNLLLQLAILAIVRRHDDAARHRRRSRSRSAWPSTRTCSSTSASARSCAPARARARRSRSATTRPSAPSSTATSPRSSPASILAQYGTGPIKGFAVTLIIGIVVQPLHRRLLHAPRVRLVGPRPQGQERSSVGLSGGA